MTQQKAYEYAVDVESRGLQDKQLVFPIEINGFNSLLAYEAYGKLNFEEATFVGLPGSDGNGVINTHGIQPCGILRSCSDKESAWSFVTAYLQYRKPLEISEQTGALGIPVLKKQFDEDYDRSEEYVNSINHIIKKNAVGASSADNEERYIPQEYKDRLRDYILGTRFNIYFSYEMYDIVEEECEPVFIGERSPEQAAEIIENRITTILSERS